MPLAFTQLSAASASTSNTATYAGNAGTPVAGDMLICFVTASGNNSGSLTGTFTWNLLTSLARGTDTIYVFWAYAATATSTTPTFNSSSGNATGSIISAVRIAGGTGTGTLHLRQFKISLTSNANPAIAMDNAILTGNGVLVYASNVLSSTTQWTAPTGFTQISQVGYSTPTNSGQTAFATSGITASTLTWTNANAGASVLVALEFYNDGAGPVNDHSSMGFFGGITSI